MLFDNHGRIINYLRLAITDKCNLRCFYCMPEQGLKWLPKRDLMTYDEMFTICSLLVKMGIEKIRITGGEPFIRPQLLEFIEKLQSIEQLKEVSITTNGVLTASLVPELKRINIKSVNLSLDTLNRERFKNITYRDDLDKVLHTLDQLLQYEIETKINAVVMKDKNTEDILPLVELSRKNPVSIRFIEEMPFNGIENHWESTYWNHIRIFETIQSHYPDIQKATILPYSTSVNYQIPGFKGTVGIIPAYTRSFCGTCNRIRVTPSGMVKTCLYDEGQLNIRDLIRENKTEAEITEELKLAFKKKAKDGWEAEELRNKNTKTYESMAAIGG